VTLRRFEESVSGVRAEIVRHPGTSVSEADFRLEEEHPQEGTVVLALYGDVDLHSAGELDDRLAAVIARGASSLVVDLTGVTFVDSQGIGALLRGTRRFDAGAGQLRLVVPGGHIRRVFEITSLDRVFALDQTRQEALARGRPVTPEEA
jgi:anti-sigma B factor antagonist